MKTIQSVFVWQNQKENIYIKAKSIQLSFLFAKKPLYIKNELVSCLWVELVLLMDLILFFKVIAEVWRCAWKRSSFVLFLLRIRQRTSMFDYGAIFSSECGSKCLFSASSVLLPSSLDHLLIRKKDGFSYSDFTALPWGLSSPLRPDPSSWNSQYPWKRILVNFFPQPTAGVTRLEVSTALLLLLQSCEVR